LRPFLTREPSIQSSQVDGGCGQDMLQMSFSQTNITTFSKTKATNSLRNSAFNARSFSILLPPLFRLLLLSGNL
jgi:hypothetical protein